MKVTNNRRFTGRVAGVTVAAVLVTVAGGAVAASAVGYSTGPAVYATAAPGPATISSTLDRNGLLLQKSLPAGQWMLSAAATVSNAGVGTGSNFTGLDQATCTLVLPSGGGFQSHVGILGVGEALRVTVQQPVTLTGTTTVGLRCAPAGDSFPIKAVDYTLSATQLETIG